MDAEIESEGDTKPVARGKPIFNDNRISVKSVSFTFDLRRGCRKILRAPPSWLLWIIFTSSQLHSLQIHICIKN